MARNKSMMEDLIDSGDVKPEPPAQGQLFDDKETGNPTNLTPPQTGQGAAEPPTPPAPQPTPAAAQPAEPTPPSPQSIDINAVVAEKTGGKYKSVDELTAAAEKPVVNEINFVNETSKKVFELLKEGKVDDVISIYQEQSTLSNIDKMSADDVLKLKIKYENPSLSQSEIEEEFLSKYGVEKPDYDEDLDDPKTIERADKKYQRELAAIEREKKKDLADAKKFLNEKKKEIVLPEVANPSNDGEGLPEYDEAEVLKARQTYEQSIEPAINGMKPLEVTYKDDELEIKTSFNINEQDKSSLTQKLKEFRVDEYFLPKFLNPDGTFNVDAIAKSVYIEENLSKIIEAHVAQAVSQTRASLIKDIKGADFSGANPAPRTNDEVKTEEQKVDFFFSRT